MGQEEAKDSRILVLDPFASSGDVASARRLEAVVELIIAQDHEVKHQHLNSAAQSHDAEKPAQDDGYAQQFDVSVNPSAALASQPLDLGSLHSKTEWRISNRYYEADVELASLSLPLDLKSVPGKQKAEEQEKVNAALKAACEGVPAVIIVLTQARSEEGHSALLQRVANAVEAYDLEVSLVISTATSAMAPAESIAPSTMALNSDETEKLVELYAEFGWEFIDLMAQNDEEDGEDEDAYKLTSVSAGEEEVFGIERVRQALSAHMWPGLKRRDDRRGRNAPIIAPVHQREEPLSARPQEEKPIISFSDTPLDEHDALDDQAEVGVGNAYVERLQERINESYQALNLGQDGRGTAETNDVFGPFQQGDNGQRAVLDSSDAGTHKSALTKLGDGDNDAFWSRASSSAGMDEDFSAHFGPEPTSTAFFASPSGENDDLSGVRNGTGQSEHLDAQDEAILSALSLDLVDDANRLHAELARMALPAGPGTNGDMEQLFGSMSSIKAHMDSNARRIQAIQDPVQQSREAAKFALAYTQMLMGGLDDEDGDGDIGGGGRSGPHPLQS